MISDKKSQEFQKQIIENFDELELNEMKTLLNLLTERVKNAEMVSFVVYILFNFSSFYF